MTIKDHRTTTESSQDLRLRIDLPGIERQRENRGKSRISVRIRELDGSGGGNGWAEWVREWE